MNKVITFGEVMLRLSPPHFARINQAHAFNATYGGGEANVAIALANWGVTASHVSCFPDNDLGYAAADFLRKYNVDTQQIVFTGERLGIYFLETGAAMRASKVLYDRAHSAFAQLEPGMFNWEKILSDARWFHWTGITPAISAGAAQACYEAIQTARRMGITVSADVTYRKNLWQYGKSVREVMPDLVANSDVVLIGENEANEIFGTLPSATDGNPFISVSQQLMDRYPRIKQILTTQRETLSATHNRLSAMMWNGQVYFQTGTHDITPVIDRIGGGDAFIAGYIYSSLKEESMQQSLDFALAASVLKHTIEGDANLATVAEITQVASGDASGRLSR